MKNYFDARFILSSGITLLQDRLQLNQSFLFYLSFDYDRRSPCNLADFGLAGRDFNFERATRS